jgi:hypothetical protein
VDDNSTIALRWKPFQVSVCWRRYCLLKFRYKRHAPWSTKRHENRQAIFKASERLYIELTFPDTDEAFHRGGESWNGHGKGLRENLAERLGWDVARHDDLRVAQRLYHKQVVDGVYRLDEGALLDDFFYCLQERGVPDWLVNIEGTAGQRETVPFVNISCGHRRIRPSTTDSLAHFGSGSGDYPLCGPS